MNQDILLLMWNCEDCSKLKANINYAKAFSDNPSGKNGQTLMLYYSFSNIGFKEILTKFGGTGSENAPVLILSNKRVVTDLNEIISYMKANY
jgi:hypothetical protein